MLSDRFTYTRHHRITAILTQPRAIHSIFTDLSDIHLTYQIYITHFDSIKLYTVPLLLVLNTDSIPQYCHNSPHLSRIHILTR